MPRKLPGALRACLSAALLALAGAAHAEPTITAVTASIQKARPGKTMVKIVVNGRGLENAICALQVDHGDGTTAIREMDPSKAARFPLAIDKTYTRRGTYRITVRGVRSGLYFGCLGEADTKLSIK